MEASEFSKTLGSLVKSADDRYYSFVPAELPVRIDKDDEFVALLANASKKLGELMYLGKVLYESVGDITKNLIRPYLFNEAVLSSKIEGTMSTLNDVLENDAGLIPNDERSRGDMLEVLNYIRAQEKGIEEIARGQKINLEMIKELHSLLMHRVRGGKAQPGSIRAIQNYISNISIGKIENAVYVPPPPDRVEALLEAMLRYMETSTEPLLVKVGMMHYQFEAIHPFLDGNGRIGRLLIILYLIELQGLDYPLLYMSEYFEKNRQEYYSRLLKASTEGAYAEWLKFFMRGVVIQAETVEAKTDELLKYYNSFEDLANGAAGAKISLLYRKLFSNPITTIPKVSKTLNVSYPSAKRYVEELEKRGILKRHKHRRGRAKAFVAERVMEIYVR